MAAYRRDAFPALLVLPGVDEIPERLVTVQYGKVLLPLGHLAAGVERYFHSRAADKVARRDIKAEGANPLRNVRKAMLLVGFPKPIGRGQREIAKSRFALPQRIGALRQLGTVTLQPAGPRRKSAEQH